MAFAVMFLSRIRKFIQEKSNITATAEKIAKLFNDNGNKSHDSSSIDNGDEYTKANYSGILDSDLTSLTTAQRNIFIVTVTVLFVLSLCGNVCALFVNFRRKIRPFFRACLISLAFSDLMNTVFLTACYLSQFTADFVQIWSLGHVMCSLVPFATTCAILAGSMTVVGIALDRYFAVMKAAIGFWNPSVIRSTACVLCIWLASISIASPVLTFYGITPVYILTRVHETANATAWLQVITAATPTPPNATASPLWTTKTSSGTTAKTVMSSSTTTSPNTFWATEFSLESVSYILVGKQKLINVCTSEQKNISVYYIVVFTIIFVPCIVAVIWFNTVIARQIWQRRHLAAAARQRNLQAKQHTAPMATGPPASLEPIRIERPKYALIGKKSCTCKSMQMSSSTTASSSMSNSALCDKAITTTSHDAPHIHATAAAEAINTNHIREARHLRIFIIILLMMALFLFLRLPAWIFLLMRMYGNYPASGCWVLYYVFGLLNLTSSVLNPLFYTFLTAAMKHFTKIKAKLTSLHCCKNSLPSSRCQSLLCWHKSNATTSDHKYIVRVHSLALQPKVHSKDCTPAAINNEKDEGVDCNDEVGEGDVCSVHDYTQKIYAIIPVGNQP